MASWNALLENIPGRVNFYREYFLSVVLPASGQIAGTSGAIEKIGGERKFKHKF